MNLVHRLSRSVSQGAAKAPWLTILFSGFFLAIYFAGPAFFKAFLLDKAAVGRGEFWRLVTGHFVHCNFEHLFWDLVGWVILGAVIEMHRRKDLIPALIFTCLGVSLWLCIGDQSHATYCGLSGMLNGLLIVAAVTQWRSTGTQACLWVIPATLAKMIYEFTTHQTIFTGLGPQAVPSAHAAGFICGFLYIMLRDQILKYFVDGSSGQLSLQN